MALILGALALLAATGSAPAGALEPDALAESPIAPEDLPPRTGHRPDAEPQPASAGEELVGLFAIDAGQCGAAGVESGAWFRMLDPTGRYIENNDSPCPDRTWTPLAPGTDGGLLTGDFQPHPDPAFDGNHGAAARITQPQTFFGTRFSTATTPTDPQTGVSVAAPTITHDGSANLGGDLRAFAAAWQRQHFNQGAPKPDGSTPGGTELATGTYDPASGAFAVGWSSLIEGGPFDGFTGVWHFAGTFRAAGSTGSGETPPGTAGAGGPGAGGSSPLAGASPAGSPASGATGDPLARTGGGPAHAGLLLLAAAAVTRTARRGWGRTGRPAPR